MSKDKRDADDHGLLDEPQIGRCAGVDEMALMATSHLTGPLDRPARTGPATYPVSSPRTLADAIAQGGQVADHERQQLALRDAPLPDIADLCAAQGVPMFALEMPDDVSGMFLG